MGKKAISTPLIFQSKFLCFSLLYLLTSIFLALYTSLSSTKCLLRSSPFDPIHSSLFSYPSSYGEHKYSLPTSRTTCSSPVFFSDYMAAVKEMQDLCKNSSSFFPNLRYMEGNADSFGGNFPAQKRISYFKHENESIEIPCGLLKKFPIADSDRKAMESCHGVVVVSAIFNDHDKIRQPKGLGSRTTQNVCFFTFIDDVTLKSLHRHKLISPKPENHKIGVWRLVKVSTKNLYESPAMNGIIPKYLVHRLFPNSRFSIWLDAKLQLMVDPLLLIRSLVVAEKVDMAIAKHPFHIQVMDEAMATARWRKWWDIDGLNNQMETYCENGLKPWSPNKLPYTSGILRMPSRGPDVMKPRLAFHSGHLIQLFADVPDSALILREHNPRSDLFSCLMFNELEAFNPRDQLAFAFVRDQMSPNLRINMFEVEVFEHVALEYRHNLKPAGGSTAGGGGPTNSQIKRFRRARFDHDLMINANGSKCWNYLLDMWSDSES